MVRVVGSHEQVAFFRANRVGVLLRERPRPYEAADSRGNARLEQPPAAGTILSRHAYAAIITKKRLSESAADVDGTRRGGPNLRSPSSTRPLV
jgi:hypothetical protein